MENVEGQSGRTATGVYYFFLLNRLNLFSLSFSLSFSRFPGLDSVVMVTEAGRVCARTETGVLWVLLGASECAADPAVIMAWIHELISSCKGLHQPD